jgi:hypothetical protein
MSLNYGMHTMIHYFSELIQKLVEFSISSTDLSN